MDTNRTEEHTGSGLAAQSLGPKASGDGKPSRSILYARYGTVPALLLAALWLIVTAFGSARLWMDGPYGQKASNVQVFYHCGDGSAVSRVAPFDFPALIAATRNSPECEREIRAEWDAEAERLAHDAPGDRVDAALGYGWLAGSLLLVLAYRRSRRQKAWWAGSVMEKASRWSTRGSEILLIGVGSSILPHVFGLTPQDPWSMAALVAGFAVFLAAHRKDIVRDFLAAAGSLRELRAARRRLGSFRAVLKEDLSSEQEELAAAGVSNSASAKEELR